MCVAYAIIVWDRVNRAIIALVAAGIVVLSGALDQAEALKGIDWNTIGTLAGLMIITSIAQRSGVFQYAAIRSAQAARAHPAVLLLLVQLVTFVVSALLNNVSTVLLVAPVTLAVTREMQIRAVSVPVRRGDRRQYRRHGDVDRRSAQYHDRLARRSRFQRLSHSSRADRHRDPSGAGADDASGLGTRDACHDREPAARHDHGCARRDRRPAAARFNRSRCWRW